MTAQLKSPGSMAGFTLIELMVAISIAAVISGMTGYSYLKGLAERKVIQASRDLYAGFKEASSMAVNQGRNIKIAFNTINNSYKITDPDNNVIKEYIFPGYIDLYSVTGGTAGAFTINSRGMMGGGSGKIKLKYGPGDGPMARGLRVTSAGAISLINETDDNWSSEDEFFEQ